MGFELEIDVAKVKELANKTNKMPKEEFVLFNPQDGEFTIEVDPKQIDAVFYGFRVAADSRSNIIKEVSLDKQKNRTRIVLDDGSMMLLDSCRYDFLKQHIGEKLYYLWDNKNRFDGFCVAGVKFRR